MANLHNLLTDIDGIKVGHAQNMDALTGCTVVIIEKGAVGGVDQRGGAREPARRIYCGQCTWSIRFTELYSQADLPSDWMPPQES